MKTNVTVGLIIVIIVLFGWWQISIYGARYDETGVRIDNTYMDEDSSSSEIEKKIAETVRSSEPVIVYDGISIPSHAREINLSGRGLNGSLKAEIRKFIELRDLNVSNNKFTGLPAEIGQLSHLEVLNLSNNPLTGLPHELGNLQNLNLLDLRGTQYSTNDLEIIKRSLPAKTKVLTD